MEPCIDATFDMFERPPVDMSVDDFNDIELLPLSSATGAHTVEFKIPSEPEHFIDLSETRLHLKLKVTLANGKDVEANKVKLCRLFPSAIFKQVDMFLNSTLVTSSSSMYPYLSYMSALLSYPTEVKKHQMQVLEYFDGAEVPKGGQLEAYTKVNLPLMNQDRLLPNNIDVLLRFTRSRDDFVLQKTTATDTEKYAIKIEHMSLFVRKIKPSATVLLEHSRSLTRGNVVFPITRIFSKYFTLQQGSRTFDINNIVQGQLPSRVIIGLVSSDSFSGSYDNDCFTFAPNDLTQINLVVNGKSIPQKPIDMDFNKGKFRRAYHNLINTLQGTCSDTQSLGLSESEYKTRSCLFAFAISKTLGSEEAIPTREEGVVSCKLTFEKDLTKNLNAVFCLEYQNNCIETDSLRNIFIDYPA